MHYTYVLLSSKDGLLYTGTTRDLPRRINEHRGVQVRSTSHRRPLRLVYHEACVNASDAFRRERYVRIRLAGFLTEIGHEKLERH